MRGVGPPAPLDEWRVVPYLAGRGLLPRGDPWAAPPATEVRDGRSRILRVRSWPAGLLVKQALDRETRRDQRREAAMYRRLNAAGTGVPVPALVDHDAERGVLVLHDLPGHRPVRPEDPPAGWLAVGAALAALHRLPAPPGPGGPPWILSLRRPRPSILRVAGDRRLAVLRRVQGAPVWRVGLAGLRRRWSPRAAVHGDLRLDNVLVDADGDVRLVDWEGGGPGDPAADVGWVLGDLLARCRSVASTIPAARALWRGYGSGPEGDGASRGGEVARWAGARLLLVAWERATDPAVDRWLALGADALGRPRALARRLLGAG